ncbi:DUF5059 domain-containing protein [Halovenus rubra]|uniref:DUF5059 domain-containing protein n=2 Tax=Halovenus rubra TaxID=869890 RepID=A0ACC7E5M0_9EURY|nr:DUF5059 domain-containing protein [Halovenus rubra]
MEQTRRNWLRSTGAVLTSVALAGCSSSDDGDDGESDEPTKAETETKTETPGDEESGDMDNDQDEEETEDSSSEQQELAAVDIGVVSEWNAIRTRLRDAVILGHAEEYAAGVGVVGNIFERFETASGEYNAHEMLEETSKEHYEGFEEGLGKLSEQLEAENLEGTHEAMHTADKHLRQAQASLTNKPTVGRLSMLVMATHVEDAAMLLQVGDYDDAEHELSKIGDKFEEAFYDAIAAEDQEAADTFVEAMDRAAENAASNPETATEAAHEAFNAATRGMHAITDDRLAGAGHMAALQARGWDGTALARLEGVSASYAHAAALNNYRVHARDAELLYEEGESEAAVSLVEHAFERFETARAHDALEEANHDAYEAFEGGLDSLATGIQEGDDDAVSNAAGTVEEAIRTGITALTGEDQTALLEAGYIKARLEDAHERYQLGSTQRATEIAQNVFADFEADAGGFHETLEETDEELYNAFEHEHLEGFIEASQNGDDEAVTSHITGVRESLLSFETALGSEATVSGVESSYITARLRDAVVLDHLGSTERAQEVATTAFQHFEAGAGGFHEAIEEADHETYESFEESVTTLQDSLGGDSSTEALGTATDNAVGAIYSIVMATSGGSNSASFVSDVFAHFENATAHDMLEEADQEAYESFERSLDAYVGALEAGEGAQKAATQYADASLKAQFAVAGASDDAPVEAHDGDSGTDDEGGNEDEKETELKGGPNVVEGVPDDADHIVDMTAVAFEPEEVTISQGDTVAWTHAGGEAHSVTAYESEIPTDADYWASGDFASESAARDGWENGKGAVQSGEAYVKTFETTGTHEYLCIPHEAAGMVGSVIVEK